MFEQQIKDALKKAGLDEGLWAIIKVENEGEITNAVKLLSSTVDRRVTAGVKTFEDNQKKKADEDKAEAERLAAEKKAKESGGTLTPEQQRLADLQATIESLTKTVETVVKTVETVSTKVTVDEKTATAKAALKEAGLADNLIKYVNLDNVPESIEALKSDFVATQQAIIDEHLKSAGVPSKAAAGGASTDAAIEKFAEAKNTGGTTAVLPAKKIG